MLRFLSLANRWSGSYRKPQKLLPRKSWERNFALQNTHENDESYLIWQEVQTLINMKKPPIFVKEDFWKKM